MTPYPRAMSFRDLMQDAALENLDAQHRAADASTTDALGSLASQLAAVKAELAHQKAATTVLVQMLMERGLVDGAQLKARFDQALGQAQAAANMVSCARCRKQVERRSTQITSSGAMCDACFRAFSLDE
jgi:hypothetical protein